MSYDLRHLALIEKDGIWEKFDIEGWVEYDSRAFNTDILIRLLLGKIVNSGFYSFEDQKRVHPISPLKGMPHNINSYLT